VWCGRNGRARRFRRVRAPIAWSFERARALWSCIAAVTDAEIEEIWRAVPDGTPIVIEP
jgi:hypothetical protein